MSGLGNNIRYNTAFKHKVVKEIEQGNYTILQASRVYDISRRTLYVWIEGLGKDHLINRIVRVEMRNESDRIKALEKEKQALETALAQAHLKIIALESTIESAEALYKLDIKKKSGTKASGRVSKK